MNRIFTLFKGQFWKGLFFSLVLISSSKAYADFSHSNSETILPLAFSQGLPSTYIYIDNKKVPLLLDSGGSNFSLVLSKPLLKHLKVKYVNDQSCVRDIEGKFCMKNFIIPTVEIGKNMIFHDVKGEELIKLWGGNDKGFVETEASRNGVIGLNLLKKLNFLIDYKSKKMIITNQKFYPNGLDLKRCYRTGFEFDKGIMVDFVINNKKLKMVVDTGSTLSYLKSGVVNIDQLSCAGIQAKEFKNCHYANINLFENSAASEKFFIRDIKIPFDGLIGAPFLRKHPIFIDSYNKLIYMC